MLSRRAFVGMGAAATIGLQPGKLWADSPGRCSVMLWALESVARSFEDRLDLVARAGYRNVEMVREFVGWDEATWTRTLARLQQLRLEVDAIAPLKLGFADPAGGEAMLAELEAVLPALRRLGRPQVILVSGPGVAGAETRQRAAALETLGRVAQLMRREELVAVIEPIDRLENPPVYLDGVAEAFAIVRELALPEVRVLYDFFHEQRTHGNLLEKLDGHVEEIGLVHIADVPGRHQPGTGEIRYPAVYEALRRLGYHGRVAMEFYPQGDAAEVLRAARVQAEQELSA